MFHGTNLNKYFAIDAVLSHFYTCCVAESGVGLCDIRHCD